MFLVVLLKAWFQVWVGEWLPALLGALGNTGHITTTHQIGHNLKINAMVNIIKSDGPRRFGHGVL